MLRGQGLDYVAMMSGMVAEWLTVRTGDGRNLEVLRDGPSDGRPLVFHSGTPSAAVGFPALSDAVAELGWQLVTWSRPGYSASTAYAGRSVADVTTDTAAVLDHLGQHRFVTLGWSGGGPHALACAALMPDRCDAAATLAGVAPYPAEGLDWLAGMGPENLEEFGAAIDSPAAISAFLEAQVPARTEITGEQVADSLGGLIDEVDRAALTGDFADMMALSLRRAVSTGVAGWRDDDLAFVKPWGFDVADIAVPVSVWQGAHDRMVPYEHGVWLATHIPGSRAHLRDDEGHLSLVSQLPRILADLDDLTD